MKKYIIFIVWFFSIFFSGTLFAQNYQDNDPVMPLKSISSVLFGKDIVINDQPTQTQQKVALCYAFNGWLFAAVTYKDPLYGTNAVVTVLKSIDNGLTWTIVLDAWYPGGGNDIHFSSVDIVTIGNSIESLKFILALVATGSYTLLGDGFVDIYNAGSGMFESNLFSEGLCYEISLASDYLYPAANSNPHSIGVLYSKHSNIMDSIIFRSSSNGGISLDGRQAVAATGNHFHKVALAYGRSPSWNTGRYFAVWEEQDDYGNMPGRIYTSHTNPNFNSPFTTLINLDGLDALDFKLCMNPAIACQYNNLDNDSSNLSQIVLFEKYNQTNQMNDIRGYFNLQAADHSYFKKLIISDSVHNNLQPDINFNPYDSTFMVTYYDSTLQKLPFLTNNFNLTNPDNWNIVSSGYNDNSNLSVPYPKIEYSSNLQTGANVWITGGGGGNRVAMFDAPSSTWTGISEISSKGATLISTFPNPCINEITFAFELKKADNVIIRVFSILGQPLEIITNQSFPEGKNFIQYNVSDFPTGNYLYCFSSGNFTITGRFLVIR